MLTRTTLAIVAIGLIGGCAADTAGITTSAVDPKSAPATATAKVDPACVTLMSQIDSIRKEGVTDRVEKVASTGKTKTVAVKRASLARMTELDKANAEFQAKCSTISPRPAQAAAPSPVTGAITNAAAAATTKAHAAVAASTKPPRCGACRAEAAVTSTPVSLTAAT